MKNSIRKIIKGIKKPSLAFSYFICKVRSFHYSKYIDEGKGKIIIRDPHIKVKIIKGKNARLCIDGNLSITPFLGGLAPVIISMQENSRIEILGDFIIGDGVRIHIQRNGLLSIKGKKIESASGITANTLIMVYKKITIGVDFLCAWDVFISDSDWHTILGQNYQKDITIGDHVWIANNNQILKGSIIGNNCIVASFSKICNKIYPDNVLVGGIPAKIIKTNIEWNRDII